MKPPKTTKQDKINHFVKNLENTIIWGEKSYQSLLDKVQKVFHTKSFKNFCIEKHNQ